MTKKKQSKTSKMYSFRVPLSVLKFLKKLNDIGLNQTKFILDSIHKRKEQLAIVADWDLISSYEGYGIYEGYKYLPKSDNIKIVGYKAKLHDWESDLLSTIEEVKKEIDEDIAKEKLHGSNDIAY